MGDTLGDDEAVGEGEACGGEGLFIGSLGLGDAAGDGWGEGLGPADRKAEEKHKSYQGRTEPLGRSHTLGRHWLRKALAEYLANVHRSPS